jgi:hypothetical protein
MSLDIIDLISPFGGFATTGEAPTVADVEFKDLPEDDTPPAGAHVVMMDLGTTSVEWPSGTPLIAPAEKLPLSDAATTALGLKADKAANLSDLASAATARTNLGLGTAATTAASAYATSAQGTKADSALQPAGNGSALTGLTKSQVGLGNVDNTADSAKPVSTATQTALDLKASSASLATHVGDVANPHSVTKTQVGLGNVPNTDATARASHTGSQAASTISDFAEAVDDRVASLLVAGSGVTLTYNDGANTLTVAASGGGGGSALPDGVRLLAEFGAVGDGTTDDTAAIQDAIDWAGAVGGTLLVPPGIYQMDGPQVVRNGASAQVHWPEIELTGGPGVGLRIAGTHPQSMTPSVIGSFPTPATGAIFRSTATSGAVFGGKTDGSGMSYPWTIVNVHLQDILVRLPANPQATGIDLGYAAACRLTNVIVDSGEWGIDDIPEPTATGQYGVILPRVQNGAYTRVDSLLVIGCYTGIRLGEHADCDSLSPTGCYYAIEVGDNENHAMHARRVLDLHCRNGIRVAATSGFAGLDVDQYDTEYMISSWQSRQYDLDDPANRLYGQCRSWTCRAFVGWTGKVRKSGGANFAITGVRPIPAPVLDVADDFNAPTPPAMPANWTWPTGWAIDSYPQARGAGNAVYWTSTGTSAAYRNAPSADTEFTDLECWYYTGATGFQSQAWAMVFGRSAATPNAASGTWFEGGIQWGSAESGGQGVVIRKRVAGTSTILAGPINPPGGIPAGDWFRVRLRLGFGEQFIELFHATLGYLSPAGAWSATPQYCATAAGVTDGSVGGYYGLLQQSSPGAIYNRADDFRAYGL